MLGTRPLRGAGSGTVDPRYAACGWAPSVSLHLDEPEEPDLRVDRVDPDSDLVVFSWTPGHAPPLATDLDVPLTLAERCIYTALLAGFTDREIAELRQTRRGTVTKQIHGLYRKLGVRSRRELTARSPARRAR